MNGFQEAQKLILTKQNTKAAEPAVCNRAANKGHWNTTLEIPVRTCKSSNVSKSLAIRPRPDMTEVVS